MWTALQEASIIVTPTATAGVSEDARDARGVAHIVCDYTGRLKRLEVEHYHRVQIQPGHYLCNYR